MRQPRLALTSEQLTALLSAADPRHRLALSLAGDCGLRVGELTALHLADVDRTGCTLHVMGKGRKPRVVPFAGRTAALLPVFRHLSWNPPLVARTVRTVERWVRAAARRSAIVLPPGNCVHCLRHTYATRLVRAGVRLDVVQRLLGHSKLATTAIYLHSSIDDLHDAMATLTDHERQAAIRIAGGNVVFEQKDDTSSTWAAGMAPRQKIIDFRPRRRG